MTKSLIRRHQELVAIPFRVVEQYAIWHIRPRSLECGIHYVFDQLPPQRRRHTLIKQDFQATEPRNSRVSWPRTLSACQRSTPGEPLQKLFNCGLVPEVIEQHRNRHSRARK